MAGLLGFGPCALAQITFTPGDLVVSVYGRGATGDTTTYLDNLASPITLQQLGLTFGPGNSLVAATPAGQLVLPQSGSNGQNPISGEFGSSSEGILQLSGDGHSLTIAGYAVNAAQYNSNPASYGGTTKSCIRPVAAVTCNPLAQTATQSSAGVVGVQRVVALVGANGSVNTSTTLGAAFSGNNPRSVVTANGTSFYVSGQGLGSGGSGMNDPTQGLVYAALGAHTSTTINDAYDSRVVSIHNGNLYLSQDSTEGQGVAEYISKYNGLPTAVATSTVLSNISSKFSVTSASQLNSLGSALGGKKIYLSPEQYLFASNITTDDTLYIADSGNPKGDNNGSGKSTQGLSDGGLQKWSLVGGTWKLDYTLSAGLGLVSDTTACTANQTNCGTTGLIGLTGEVVGGNVELFATNSTLGDLDQTYLYGITDSLAATTLPATESFTKLYTAGSDQVIRGVSFAPVAAAPEPSAWALMIVGLGGIGAMLRRARKITRGQAKPAVSASAPSMGAF